MAASRVESRRRARARRRFAAVAVVLLAGIAVAVALESTGSSPPPTHHKSASSVSTTTTLPPTTSTTTTSTTTTTTTTLPDPGTLPQTSQFPSATDPQFTAEMNALWQGVVQGSVVPALPAFFPRTAYVQLKTGIANPSGDWQNRLVADYALDIAAAHALLGPVPQQATLMSVSVPSQYGHWIPAGVCANGIGYFEVANSRVVYQLDGQTHSFGIASLISWRGEWYVVHLGAILRNSSGGEVDDPEVGAGYSVPSETC
jgi:hypothetical protein